MLCVLQQWFLANLSYQEALSDTQVAIVNILSSTSGQSALGPWNKFHVFLVMAVNILTCVLCSAVSEELVNALLSLCLS